MAPLAAEANFQDRGVGGREGCCREAVPLMPAKEIGAGALSENHMCQALEECWLSESASQKPLLGGTQMQVSL